MAKIPYTVKGELETTLEGRIRREALAEYSNGKQLYGWHISDLVIYDEPKDLGEFSIKKPPQSWCYVKEREDNGQT